jgi:N-acetylmuramoyl-L-alanine amidase
MKVCPVAETTRSRVLSVWITCWALLLGFHLPAGAQKDFRINKIVIDPGHGGKDPGCNGHHSREKEIALAIGLELGRQIKATHPDVEVIYTRDKDVFIPPNERAAIANRNKADLFISIHCNYIGIRNRASGSETYVLGLHRAEDNLEVAKRENAAILMEDDYERTYEGFDPNSPEGHIILSMFQNAYLEQSIQIATHIESNFKKNGRIPSRGVKQAGFLVLRETAMPSVLVETGFLSADLDEKYLMDKDNQREVALAMRKAFSQYKLDMEKQMGEPVAQSRAKEDPSTSDGMTDPLVRPTVPDSQVVYRVQVAASGRPDIEPRLRSLEDLEVVKEGEMFKFLVGFFTTPYAARQRLSALKANGFEGAFIVAYKGGLRLKT